jgi:murein DD-endopeptidase MepM/ murein hydrolase activator NlpD
MRHRTSRHGSLLPALAACFAAGMIAGWWLRSGAPVPVLPDALRPDAAASEPARRNATRDLIATSDPGPTAAPVATTGEPLIGPRPSSPAAIVAELRRHDLRLPIDDADPARMKGGFAERRDGGGRAHEAVDLLAPRHTPVRAVEGGSIARLFTSRAGGLTIYQFDPTGQFVYYYAHLERYADGLREGQTVMSGQVIGYVGTSGNAPPDTPHLHFAIFQLGPERQWWKGRPIDPYLVFSDSTGE